MSGCRHEKASRPTVNCHFFTNHASCGSATSFRKYYKLWVVIAGQNRFPVYWLERGPGQGIPARCERAIAFGCPGTWYGLCFGNWEFDCKLGGCDESRSIIEGRGLVPAFDADGRPRAK